MMLFRLAVAGTALLLVTAAAHAEDLAAAKLHYERGTNLFDLQRYLDAAKEYEAAFEAKPDPALLFNIAQAFRLGGEYSKAIAAYRSYLRRVPDAENRSEIERRIAELEALNDEQKRGQPTPPATAAKAGEAQSRPTPTRAEPAAAPPAASRLQTTPARLPESHRHVRLIAGIAVGAVGVAAIGIGGAFEGLAASTNDSLSHPAQGTVFDPNKEQTLKNDQTAGGVLLAIGGAALITGVVVAILNARRRHATPAIAASVEGRSVGAFLDATF